MAKDSIHTPEQNEHGSAWSYTAGFLASLILTVIPYLLVTRQVFVGTSLLLVILGLAVLQMLIQMFFFLHLGRGPKPLYNVIFFIGTAGMIVLVVGASLIIMANLYHNMSPEEYTTRLSQDENIAQVDGQPTGACQENKDNNDSHMIMIKGSKVTPQHIQATRCDTLVFMSDDNAAHTFSFGTPEDPSSYGGLFEVAITASRTKTITLNQTGDFTYYDTANDAATGHISVRP